MASKKDLVEAHAYNRRRLVTAFVSGAPDGREVEPSRPGKAIIAGLVLAVLVVGAGAAAGVIKPTVKDGWNNNSLVIGRDSGARYFAKDGALYPIANTTSARLLVPAGDFKVVFAPEDRIAAAVEDVTLGIDGAPDSVATQAALIQTDWVSCLSDVDNDDLDKGTSLKLSREASATPIPGQGIVVTAPAGETFVITDRYRYQVAKGSVTEVKDALGLATATDLPVTSDWLNQFEANANALVPPQVKGFGQPLPAGQRFGEVTQIGQIVAVGDGDDATRYVVTGAALATLTPVQYEMYKITGAREIAVDRSVPLPAATGELPGTEGWPVEQATPYDHKGVACALLTKTNTRTSAHTVLAAPVGNKFLGPKTPGNVRVDAGGGALVNDGAAIYLVDAFGYRYMVGGPDEVARLGYDPEEIPFVPPAWVEALRGGKPALVATAAAKPVTGTAAGDTSSAASASSGTAGTASAQATR